MRVLISNRQNPQYPPKIPPEKVKTAAKAVLNALASPDAELSILLVGDSEMAEMNETYRKRKGPTNVISFPMNEGDFAGLHPELLGDVVICADTAQREAEESGIDILERMEELLVHGILHLFGYDHEASDEAYEKMDLKSREILEEIRRDDILKKGCRDGVQGKNTHR